MDPRTPADPAIVVVQGLGVGSRMRASGLREVVLVGISVGSQMARAAAARHPDACRLLVLGSPTVDWRRRTWSAQLWRWQLEQSTQSMRVRGIQLVDYRKAGCVAS